MQGPTEEARAEARRRNTSGEKMAVWVSVGTRATA